MSDQLSLRFEPALPALPRGLRPMLEKPLAEPFDSPAHMFEPVWGGARALALIGPAEEPGGGEVRLVAEDGTSGPAPIDLAGLAMRVAARSAVLDGEIVVVDGTGRLDREELGRRFGGEPGRSLSYLAFDLLHIDGKSLLGLPLERRRALLRKVLRPGDEVVLVPSVATDGRALFEAVAAQGLHGVRARQLGSPYLPGVRSRLWRSIAVAGIAETIRGAPAVASSADLSPNPEQKAHVLALIRRLPLEFEDDIEPPALGA